MQDTSLLSRISEPSDLSALNYAALDSLAAEIRKLIIETVSRNGGHLASNLGVVELTIALHRVFHSPEDQIVWDVGHQCYTHKLLTGRRADFSRLRQAGGIAGFPKRSESPHDAFDTGHASTSISAALGLLAGGRLAVDEARRNDTRVIAVIGDGALTGGLAYEALSHAGQLGLPLIVILNDNAMSISRNVGALSKYLSRLSMKSKYQSFRRGADSLIKNIPVAGRPLMSIVNRLKRAVKAVFYTDNFFVDLGFEYAGPIDGHNIQQIERLLSDVKKLDHPVVVHVLTKKGRGYGFAETDPSAYHGVSAFSVDEGLSVSGAAQSSAPPIEYGEGNGLPAADNTASADNVCVRPSTFTDAFGAALVEAAESNPHVAAITAAMEHGTGLARFKARFPDRLFDVGIAEEHAVTFAAGLACKGVRPVVALYSTFSQRAWDQIIHDIALQNLPVTFCLDRAGFVGEDGETHQGLFDIAFFRMVPNTTVLSPADCSELKVMLEFALSNLSPIMIRYPKDVCPDECEAFSQPLERGRGVFVRQSEQARVCIAFTGGLYRHALAAVDLLAEAGVAADAYNLRFLKPVDEDAFCALMNSYKTFLIAEEGIRSGGFGEYAAALAAKRRCSARVITLAVEEDFISLGTRDELLQMNGLDGEGIFKIVKDES